MIDEITEWEQMSVNGIASIMVTWLNYHSVTFTTESRPAVASRVWHRLEIHKTDNEPHANMYIDGQRLDIVKKRLIEYLDSENLRPKKGSAST